MQEQHFYTLAIHALPISLIEFDLCRGDLLFYNDIFFLQTLKFTSIPKTLFLATIEPRCEKTGLLGFQSGPTQTGLYSHRTWLAACNFVFRKYRDCTICVAKTKALISFAVTAKLICVFVFAFAKIRFSHNEAQFIPFVLSFYQLRSKQINQSLYIAPCAPPRGKDIMQSMQHDKQMLLNM